MKQMMLLFLGCIIITNAMQKPEVILSKELARELKQIITSYKKLEPAIDRLKIWFKVPGHEKLYDNPFFMETLFNQLASKFKQDPINVALLFNTPGTLHWAEIKNQQLMQKNLAQRTIKTTLPADQIVNKLIDIYKHSSEAEIMLIIKDYPQFASIDLKEETPLTLAVSKGYKNVVQLLISQGARVNKRNKLMKAPLGIAASRQLGDIVKILLLAGADPNIRNTSDNIDQVTPLMIAAMRNAKQIMEDLLQAGARVYAQDQDGNTALMRALMFNSPDEIIILLLNHSISSDLAIKNRAGDTALTIAIKNRKRTDLVQELLNSGAQITPEALQAAHSLLDNVESKKAIIESLSEKQINPDKTFGAARIHGKL